jgi:hypothetical protein
VTTCASPVDGGIVCEYLVPSPTAIENLPEGQQGLAFSASFPPDDTLPNGKYNVWVFMTIKAGDSLIVVSKLNTVTISNSNAKPAIPPGSVSVSPEGGKGKIKGVGATNAAGGWTVTETNAVIQLPDGGAVRNGPVWFAPSEEHKYMFDCDSLNPGNYKVAVVMTLKKDKSTRKVTSAFANATVK